MRESRTNISCSSVKRVFDEFFDRGLKVDHYLTRGDAMNRCVVDGPDRVGSRHVGGVVVRR